MTTTHLHIKNMCCDRCIEVIRKLLKSAGYNRYLLLLEKLSLQKVYHKMGRKWLLLTLVEVLDYYHYML